MCVLSDTYIVVKGFILNPFYFWVRYYLFLKTYVTSKGAFSQIVLYYQHLSIARYQVGFYANNYFD